MDTHRFRDHRRGTGRRGRRTQGPGPRRHGRRHRPPLVRRQLPAHRLPPVEVAARGRRAPPRQPGLARVAAGVGPSRLHGQPGGRRRRARRHQPRQGARRRSARSSIAGPPRSSDAGRVAVRHDDVSHDLARDQHHGRGGLGLEAAADRWARRDPDLDQRAGDAGPGAAAEPGRPRWRSDRLRAGPGLRPLRRADDDRPVRAAPRADRPSAQLRGPALGSRGGRRDRPDRRPGAPGARRRPGPTAPTSSSSTTARPPRATPSCSRSVARSRSTTSASSTTASTRPAGRRSRATGGCASPTGCGSSATRPAPSCTPTRPTTRARWRSGWRSARRSCPTIARSPGRPTPSPRRRRSA